MPKRVSRRAFIASAAVSVVPSVVSYAQPRGLGFLPNPEEQAPSATQPRAKRRDAGVIDLSQSPYAKLKTVPVRAVSLQEGFWSQRRTTNVAASIPSMHDELVDHGRMDNFLRLTGRSSQPQKGPVFSDSDIYKWTEAVGFALQTTDQPQLRKTTDAMIRDIVAVQEPGGYLNTYYVEDKKSQRMQYDVQTTGHELYNIGHMLQGAIAYYRATGDRTLLDAGIRFVDQFLLPNYGPGKNQKAIVSGHPEIEMALVELYRTTGKKDYLELAGYILHGDDRVPLKRQQTTYMFCGIPFVSRTKLEGHAVRAMYACCGAADYYLETGDPAYWRALNTLWDDLTAHQLYVTGGVGARESGEAFELPNARAYGESCAAIGNMMWNWRMLSASGEAKFADVIERALYNGINSGMSLDGKTYCYRNPLAFDPTGNSSDRHSPEGKIRNAWYDTTCCPPNIERTLSSLPGYFYSTSHDGVYVHLYDNSEMNWHLSDGSGLVIRQQTNYPWSGEVNEASIFIPSPLYLSKRIPGNKFRQINQLDLFLQMEVGCMRIGLFSRVALSLLLFAGFAHTAEAQFSGNVSGVVTDASGAVIPTAALTLRNVATGEEKLATSSGTGVYQFVSLAPGNYELSTSSAGFSSSRVQLKLDTNQTLNIPVSLVAGAANQVVDVSAQAPLLDTADTRLQETLPTETLSALPLAGRSMISLVTLAPGVTGTGVTSNGSPGSGRDNFSTETQVDASANGQGAVGNMYIVDGLDVTSSIRPGVLNMTPNPDSIQEATIQTNTYSVDYGRASSVQMTMTTKSGGRSYHGNVSDYFTYQKFFALREGSTKYNPFHSNNISATVGGPIIPRHDGFFFFAIEPLRASAAVTSTGITFEDPAFTAFAKTAFPNSIGTKLLSTYPVSKVGNVSVVSVAGSPGGPACGTASPINLPCGTPYLDRGDYNDTAYRNGNQYSLRLDKTFRAERLYGAFYRTTLKSNGTNPRTAFGTTNSYYQYAIQVNETHTFSANTLNEAAFAAMRVEGIAPQTGLFSVPVVNVTGLGQGFGAGFAQGDFIQHNYHWRDVLNHTFRSHDVRLGYEGLFADDVEVFNGPHDQPTFAFNSLLDLVRDKVFTETGLSYNPVSGQRTEYDWNAAGMTHGAFVSDTWKISPKITLNYGLRWDDYGNPYSRSANTAFGNFFPGTGSTFQQQIENGAVVAHSHALNRSITDIFSPRAGIAWNPDGNGKWLIKGGAGFFHNWPTLANLQEQYRGNPPGNIFPTFFAGQTPGPLFALGTGNEKPYGYPSPTLPARPLNAQGGLTGLQFSIGGIDANLKTPVTYTYSGGVERQLGPRLVGTLLYSGSRGLYMLSGGGQVFNVSYGQDINVFAGDLILHNSTVPTRLNTSFGSVFYTRNDRASDYNAFVAAVRGRFNRAFFSASYTRSRSQDDTQVFPTYINPRHYYGPSNWDAPNRFSLAWNYQVPDYNGARGLLGRAASGWQVSGTTILQSGNPFNIYTSATFASGGDYNADGDNYDFPNVVSYTQNNSRTAYRRGGTGTVSATNFSKPTPGTDGNELFNSFRGPGFEQWDASLLKNTPITESVRFQLRFEFFNVLNHPNLTGVTTNQSNGNFGRTTGQATPRFLQIGGNLTF